MHLNFGLAHVSIWSGQISHVTLCSLVDRRTLLQNECLRKNFHCGKSIGKDMRSLIIDEICAVINLYLRRVHRDQSDSRTQPCEWPFWTLIQIVMWASPNANAINRIFPGANSSVISVVKRPKDNLSPGERCALHNLLGDKIIIVRKANKGTTTIIMSREQKIKERQILLNNPTDNYRSLDKPMAEETAEKKGYYNTGVIARVIRLIKIFTNFE